MALELHRARDAENRSSATSNKSALSRFSDRRKCTNQITVYHRLSSVGQLQGQAIAVFIHNHSCVITQITVYLINISTIYTQIKLHYVIFNSTATTLCLLIRLSGRYAYLLTFPPIERSHSRQALTWIHAQRPTSSFQSRFAPTIALFDFMKAEYYQ